MTEAGSSFPGMPLDAEVDFQAAIASLRAAGADRFDPVRLHYLETLALRTASQAPNVQRLLNAKLAQVLVEFKTRFEQAPSDKGTQTGLSARKTNPPHESLADLARALAQQSLESTPAGPEAPVGTRPELRSVQQFRSTWSKLSVDRQVTQALHQAPDKAGPINSHMLVLRSLTLMRDISPDYLNRFMSYVDTLLCLDPGEIKKAVNARETAAGENTKKTKAIRARTR